MQTVTIDGVEYGPVTPLEDLPTQQVSVFADGEWQRYEQAILLPNLQGRCLTRGEGEWEKTFAENLQRIFDEVVAHRDKLQEERDTLTARVAELEGDLEAAAGELMVDIPKPGTDEAKMLSGNVILRGERDRLNSQVDDLKAELAALREQQTLGEPLTYRQWDELKPYTPVLIRTSNHELLPSFSDAIDWHEWKHKGATIYLDPRPLPVLPAPEPSVPVPAVPSYLGCVKCEGEVYFVLGLTMHGELRLFNPACSTVYLLADPKRCCELYNHPEVVNSPTLIAALSGEGANQ